MRTVYTVVIESDDPKLTVEVTDSVLERAMYWIGDDVSEYLDDESVAFDATCTRQDGTVVVAVGDYGQGPV